MRGHRDEISMLLDLARSLKCAMSQAKTRNYDQYQRLNARFQAIDRRIRDLLAGKQPAAWAFDNNYYRQYGTSDSYRSRGFSAMLGGPLCSVPEIVNDRRGLAWAMLGETPAGALRRV